MKIIIILFTFMLVFYTQVIYSSESNKQGVLMIDQLPDATVRLSHQSVQGQFRAMSQYISYTSKQHVPGIKESGVGYYYDSKKKSLQPKTFYRILRGHPIHTKNMFDFKIEGKGFFTVEMPGKQLAFTHDGRFELDRSNRLVMRTTGFPVLGENGYIFLNEGPIVVDKKGELYQSESLIDVLRVEWVKYPDKLESLDKVVFFFPSDLMKNKQYAEKADYEILQGYLEQSSIEQAHSGRIDEWNTAHQANTRMIKAYMRNMSSSIQAGAPLQ